MIIPSNYYVVSDCWGLAAALYLDAYIAIDDTALNLPKRTLIEVRNSKRLHHLPWWTPYMHAKYLKLPDSIPVTQYVILDDGWARSTIELVRQLFPQAKEHAMEVALHLWYNILFWSSYAGKGFVTTHKQTAEMCDCSVAFASRVTLAMVDAGLIHRKWVGNGSGHFGTCYMAGPANNVDRLLAENPI